MGLPDYRNPPLVEVAIGCSFAPLDAFKLPHVGEYWALIKGEYPECEQMPPIGEPHRISDNWPSPFPRIWFVGQDESQLIQLQNGRFICNWRKRTEEADYPRYPALIEKFWDTFSGFRDFVKGEELGRVNIQECELTYTNHIFYDELLSTPAEIAELFPDFAWQCRGERFLPAPGPQSWRLRFELPDDAGMLRVDLKHAKRQSDERPLFVLQLSARGLGEAENDEDVRDWYDMSHEWVVKGFADLSSDRAQKELWERIEAD